MIPIYYLFAGFVYGVITICALVSVLELHYSQLRMRDVFVLSLIGWLVLPIGIPLELYRWLRDKW